MSRAPLAARLLVLGASAALLASCGGTEEQPPVEQIVVRQPGEAAPSSSGGAGDPTAAGKAAFAACAACHSVEPGGASGIGPNLAGVVGRKAGTLAGFTYSDAMKTTGITWTEVELDAFLTDPKGKVPGTIMMAGTVADAEKRKAIIAYLANISG